MGRPLQDLTGKRFGLLTVLSREGSKGKGTTWNCSCDCGVTCIKLAHLLKSGDTQSCGCKHINRVTTHGACGTLTYKSWCNMVHRASAYYYDDEVNAKYYNGKGIDADWIGENGFQNFLEHVGERTSEDLSIDRINPLLGYTKGNVRWIDKATQARNTRDSFDPMRGVYWREDRNKWQVLLGYNGTINYVGIYETLEQAQQARQNAELTHWGWTNGNLEVVIE